MTDDEALPDLLPWNFAPKQVLTPERILQHQAQLIGQKSEFRLKGYLERAESETQVTFSFMISAPLLNYSVRLFFCWHNIDMPYPARVQPPTAPEAKTARDEEQFREQVWKILGSDYARSVFQSLIARIGEVMAESDEPSETDGFVADTSRTSEQ